MTLSASKARRLALVLLMAAGLAQAAREIKPGLNFFSKEQDIEMGKEATKEVEKEVTVVNDQQLTNYVAKLGKRLAANSQAPDYPYSFTIVADDSINAFALPGGPIYVHSGLIKAADNEAQLAGVLSHEIGHVALRHSTHQMSKAQMVQLPLAIAAGALGSSGGLLGTLGQMGISLGVNSLFLKYSRDAEKDADIVGARTMASTGYDPIEMARFFEKLQSESGAGGGVSQFFSDHPNPGNRVAYVTEEVNELPKANYTKGATAEFAKMKARAEKIKAPTKPAQQPAGQAGAQDGSGQANSGQASSGGAPSQSPAPVKSPSTTAGSAPSTSPAPSKGPVTASGPGAAQVPGGFASFRGSDYALAYPQSWRSYPAQDGSSVTITPANGVVRQQNGGTSIARGILVGYFNSGGASLSSATNALIADLRSSNPQMQPLRGQRKPMAVGGQSGEGVLLDGPSAVANGRELVWLVCTVRPAGLFYVLMISPEGEYNALRPQYEQVVGSVRFAQ